MAMAPQDNQKPARRRSSIIAKQYVEEEGGEMPQLSELFRALPQSVQTQVARQSNSRRSGNTTQSSMNPTPRDSVARSKFMRGSSGIPVRPNSAVRPPSAAQQNTKKPPIPKAGTSNANVGKNLMLNATTKLVASRQMGSVQNLTKNLSQSMRRSLSMDSLCRDSGITTPLGYTPSWRTPATNAARQSEMSKYPASKNIKIPSSTDKATLNNMAVQVNQFLLSKNYSRTMTLAEFNRMPSSEFVNICVFVSSLMMGPSNTQNVAEIIANIFELSKLLKYPGTITKSHLKCANIPNSWPYALTFLSWLCDRVESAISPALSVKPISEISQNDYKELASESYLTLFYQVINSGRDLEDEQLEVELESYRSKLQEKYMSDIPRTTEELVAMRNAEMEKLKRLENLPEPTLTLIAAKATYEKLLQDAQTNLDNSKQKWNTYKDLESLQAEAKILQSQLQIKQKEIEELRVLIRNQPFDKRQLQSMKDEIEICENQKKTLATITDKLSNELMTKKVMKTNLEKKFYQMLSRLTVVESFQQAVRACHLDIPPIPQNPYDPSGLKVWVNSVEKIQALASEKLTVFQKQIQENLTKLHRNKNQRQQKDENLKQTTAAAEKKLKILQIETSNRRKQQGAELMEVNEEEKELSEEVSLLTNEVDNLLQEYTEINSVCVALSNKFQEEIAAQETWMKKGEDLTIGVMEEGARMNKYLDEYCATKMSELREIRIQNNLDVTMFDETLEEYAKAGITPKPNADSP